MGTIVGGSGGIVGVAGGAISSTGGSWPSGGGVSRIKVTVDARISLVGNVAVVRAVVLGG